MPTVSSHRPRGPKPKPRTATEARLHDLESNTSAARRRISGKDRLFIRLYVDGNLKDPDLAAKSAGFKEAGIGHRLASRLRDLIEAERMRLAMGEQMEVDEALRLLAGKARACERDVDQIAALRTVLQVHGVLSDKPLAATDRSSLARQVAEIVDSIKARLAGQPGAQGRIRAMLSQSVSGPAQAVVQADVEQAGVMLPPGNKP